MPKELRARLRGDEGAGVVEYVGAILVVVSIVVSLTIMATPIGGTVMAEICKAFGAECGSSTSAQPPPQPDKPCTLTSDTAGLEAGVSIAFIDIDGGGSMTIDKMSDGTYRVVLDGEAAVKAVASAGEAHGGLSIMGYGGELQLSADASAGILGRNGAEFTFPDKGAAEDFTGWVQRNLVRGGAAVAAGPVGGPAIGVGGWIWDKVTGYDYEPPMPSAIYAEGGVTGGASAGAGGITAGGSASLDLSNSVGAKYDTKTGETTVYTRVNLSGEAAAQIGFSTSDDNWGQGASGQGSVELVVGVTVDKNGEVSKVALDGAATADGSMALTHLAGFPLQGEDGRGVQMSVELPVTDANRDRIIPSLVGLGAMATTVGSHPLAEGTALPALMAEARAAGGTITAQTLDVSSSDLLSAALSLKAPAVGGLGFRLGASTSSQDTLSAYFADATGWHDWTNCIS